MKKKYNYLIIGAGIIGLSIAREIKRVFPLASICIIEKEKDVALHGSGRNSGVLHAGFYYTADSLKAKFTALGNSLMRKYCETNSLSINPCGKVVVAKDEKELGGLDTLLKRGLNNGVNIKAISEQELAEIEPNAKTFKRALYSASTATVDPGEISLCMKNELQNNGVDLIFGDGYRQLVSDRSIITESGEVIVAGQIINCAGLYADKIAKDFGFSDNFTIIPFKGIYLKYTNTDQPIKTNIYPVPNLKNPFLGVHYTVTVDNHIKIGPTAIPAFWRENYKGIDNISIKELGEIGYWELQLFAQNKFNFRQLAFEEIKKYRKEHFRELARGLVKAIDIDAFTEWTAPGIRAQLLNTKTKELVQDFVIETTGSSVHILNAVSPAFTCSISFAQHVVDKYINSND